MAEVVGVVTKVTTEFLEINQVSRAQTQPWIELRRWDQLDVFLGL